MKLDNKERKNFEITLESIVRKKENIKEIKVYSDKGIKDENRFFMMNEVGNSMWDIINERVKVSKIVERLVNEYEINNDTCEKSVINFLYKLNEANLIEIN